MKGRSVGMFFEEVWQVVISSVGGAGAQAEPRRYGERWSRAAVV
jgi:hypothetical protein